MLELFYSLEYWTPWAHTIFIWNKICVTYWKVFTFIQILKDIWDKIYCFRTSFINWEAGGELCSTSELSWNTFNRICLKVYSGVRGTQAGMGRQRRNMNILSIITVILLPSSIHACEPVHSSHNALLGLIAGKWRQIVNVGVCWCLLGHVTGFVQV